MTIQEHARFLFRNVEHTDPDQWRRCLDDVDARGLVLRCAEDPATLAAVAAKSYVHANGHDRIELPEIPGLGVGVRIHIWRGIVQQADAHNHKWVFVSRVLVGNLENHLYKAESREQGGYRAFRQTKTDTGYRLQHMGWADLYEDRIDVIREGDTYQMSPFPIHRVIAPSGFLATVSVELAPARESTDVYRQIEEAVSSQVVAPRRFSALSLRDILLDLAGRIR